MTSRTINQVKVTEQKGYISLQLPSCYSKEFYGVKQKYIAFGAKANNENFALAYEAATKLQTDLENGTFNPDNELKYKHLSKQRKKGDELRNQTLWEIYCHWIEKTKKEGKKSGNRHLSQTGERRYQQICKNIEAFPQAFVTKQDQEEIAEFLEKNYAPSPQVQMLDQLYNMVEWAKDKSLLPKNVPNHFKEFKELVGRPLKRGCPKLLEGKERFRDPEKIAWTKEERDRIIQAIQGRTKYKSFYKECDVLGLLIEFLFYTGLRHGEAFALRWDRVRVLEEGVQCAIDQSYSTKYRLTKGTKTENPRTIWLRRRAQEIIQTLKKFYESKGWDCKGDKLVFQKDSGKGFNSDDISRVWHTNNRKDLTGVGKLVEQGNLDQYLDSYSTRRTFASLQAQANQDSMTVAKYIGDNVETVYKHYYQGKRVNGGIPALEEDFEHNSSLDQCFSIIGTIQAQLQAIASKYNDVPEIRELLNFVNQSLRLFQPLRNRM